MSVRVHCPLCLQGYTIADDQCGQRIRCRNCEQIFLAERPAPTAADEPSELLPDASAPTEPMDLVPDEARSASADSSVHFYLLLGAVTLVFFALGLAAFYAVHSLMKRDRRAVEVAPAAVGPPLHGMVRFNSTVD